MMHSLKRRANFKFIAICLILPMLCITCSDQDDRMAVLVIQEYPNRKLDFSLWQLDQFYGQVQMGYLLRTDDNKIIVVDGGLYTSAEIVENFINQLGGVVDTWIVTHPHKDHIGAFLEIIRRNKVTIHKIIHSAIDMSLVQQYEPMSFPLMNDYYKTLEHSQIPVLDADLGSVLALGEGVELQILGIRNKNILVNLVNNSSLVVKISSKSKSVLFLGDLGIEGGWEVFKNGLSQNLKANYIQMAHHGQDGVDKDFYAAVGAQYALWPTPRWLWENNLDAKGYNSGRWKTLIVQDWMKELNIKYNYVSGLEGTVQID